MILRDTDVDSALLARARQRALIEGRGARACEFLLNPFRFAGPATDPDFANVVLLLHLNGANGSTTITDSSSVARAMTANGGLTLSTSRPRFGSAAAELDGVDDYVRANASSDDFYYANGAFAIEGWFETDTTAGIGALGVYANGSASNSNYAWQVLRNGSALQADIISGTTQYTATKTGITVGVKHFFQAIRSGNNWFVALDGVAGSTVDVTGVTMNNPAGSAFWLGYSLGGFYPFDGMIDEYRITKGVARSVGVPSAAFPDS